jgi:hypothetical protein
MDCRIRQTPAASPAEPGGLPLTPDCQRRQALRRHHYRLGLNVGAARHPGSAHNNHALRYRLGFVDPFGIDRHTLSPPRALSDATVIAAVFTEVIKHAYWSELVQWSREPALLSVFRFGKHRGERFDAVPIDYLQWIVEGENELTEDVKASARYWLNRRASSGPRLPGL